MINMRQNKQKKANRKNAAMMHVIQPQPVRRLSNYHLSSSFPFSNYASTKFLMSKKQIRRRSIRKMKKSRAMKLNQEKPVNLSSAVLKINDSFSIGSNLNEILRMIEIKLVRAMIPNGMKLREMK